MTEPNWDVEKVRAFGGRLLANPEHAAKLAKNLLWNEDSYAAGAVAVSEFRALSPWEQAAVVDELRNAIDKQLGIVFERYVKRAREETAQ